MYEVSVSAVALNAGARWGGQSITVTGQGFAIQKDAVSTSDNRVFVGGRRARVIEASYNKIVLETPDLLDTPALGFEHEHIWKKIRHCGLPGKNEIECLGVHLRSCAAALSWGTPADEPKLLAIAPNNMLLALPGSDGLSLDASLVDGDASTMWLSKPGSDTLKLIFDLGVSSSVTHILIRWAGRSTAAEIRVSAGAADPSTCSSETAFLEELVAWRATAAAASDDTDLLETIDLGVFFFSPRVLMVELRGLRVSLVSFGIRDVIIVDKMQLPFPSRQPILVEVGGVEASCGVQHVCSFNYSSAPEVVQVSPTNGTAGILITVNVTGLNVANCAANTVRISNVECAVQSCGGVDGQEGWIMCALGRMSGGTYAVAVTVSGAPAANNGVVFTYPVLISAVTPAAGGYGGAYIITVTGDGFHTDARRISAMLCGFPCKVTKADMTSLECVPEALFDSASSPGHSSLDIAIANGRDDATEDIESKAIVTDSGMLSGYLQPWGYEWSARVVYMRFSAVDIAQGMRVAAARLQVRAADPSCQKNSQIRIWAEATDNSEAFDPSVRGSLGTRARSQGHEDWITRSEWRWMAESQESSDLSHLINDVLARPGWRAGNALTLMLQQRTRVTGNSLPEASCNMMSADYSLKYAPKLRLQLANFTTPRALASDSVSSCSLKVTVNTASNTSTPKKCDMAKVRMTARASSSDVPTRPSQQADIGNGNIDPNLYRSVLHKQSKTLSFQEARITCASIGARLCRKSEEILVPNAGGTLEPFFGVQTAVDGVAIYVPYENLRHGGRAESAKHNDWLRVSGSEFSEWSNPGWMWAGNDANRLENEKRTNLIPCCSFIGYPAYMAVDEDPNTYWHSGVTETANLTIAVASSEIKLESIDILWSADYAREYRILMSRDETNWFQVAQNYFGDGSLDSLRLVQSCPTPLLQSFALCSWLLLLRLFQALQRLGRLQWARALSGAQRCLLVRCWMGRWLLQCLCCAVFPRATAPKDRNASARSGKRWVRHHRHLPPWLQRSCADQFYRQLADVYGTLGPHAPGVLGGTGARHNCWR